MADVIIPAHNEERTIWPVVQACNWAMNTSNVFVVADACDDRTAQLASSAGAVVIEISDRDKGSAMAAGLTMVTTDDVLFVDGDLHGLRSPHVDLLLTATPLGGMVVGLRDELTARPTRIFPPISGERRLPTRFARTIRFRGQGYRAELLIDAAVGRAGLPHRSYILSGVTNPTPHSVGGVLGGLAMWGQLVGTAAVHLPDLIRYSVGSS